MEPIFSIKNNHLHIKFSEEIIEWTTIHIIRKDILEYMKSHSKEYRDIYVYFDNIIKLDSSGVGMLISIRREQMDREHHDFNWNMYIVKPSKHVISILKLLNVTSLFKIVEIV